MSWNRKEDSPTSVESIHDYLTDLQDLSEGEELPSPILKDQGIWSLICHEMNVCVCAECDVVHCRAAAIHSRRESADSHAAT